MIAENVHRKRLTGEEEEVAACAQLEAFPERRADRPRHPPTAAVRGRSPPPGWTKRSARTSGPVPSPWTRPPCSRSGGATRAYQRLLRTAEQGYGFHYALADAQAKKQRHERADAIREALRANNTRVVGKTHG